MNTNLTVTVPIIEKIIKKLEKDFRKNQALILTESDLKCQLYSRLARSRKLEFAINKPIKERNINGPALHTELPWFNENLKLKIKPDISIINPTYLSIINGLTDNKLLSKECEFLFINSILFELKFVRNRNGITPSILQTIKNDVYKINALFKRIKNKLPEKFEVFFSFFVIFTKTAPNSEDMIKFMKRYNKRSYIKIILCSGNVDFNNEN